MKSVNIVIYALVLIVASLLSATADPMVKVTFPEKGYIYWIEFTDPAGDRQITAPRYAAGTGTTIDLAPASPDGKPAAGVVKIYDPKSGNVAAKSIENLAGKKDLKLKTADFDLVRTAKIVLKPADGKPDERVESAMVTLKDANSDEFTALVDPSSEGVAEFHDIAGGQESVTVAYSGGKMTIDLEIPLERDTPVFAHALAISSKVRTVKATTVSINQVPEEGTKDKAAARRKQSPAGWVSTLAGVIFLGIIVFIGYVVLKSRGATVEDSLRKLGVQFPQDEQGAPATVPAPEQQVDPNACQFCGQRKDPATGACACTLDASAGAVLAGGAPRLVGMQGPYAGHIFDLTVGSSTLGRDAGNTIALTEDGTSSRRHSRIERENESCSIVDEGSSNGTFVNSARITGPHTLQPGDEIQIGSTKFRYER